MAVGSMSASPYSPNASPASGVPLPQLQRPVVSLVLAPMFVFAATSLSFAFLLESMPFPAVLAVLSVLFAMPYSMPVVRVKAGAAAAGALMPVAVVLLGLIGGALTGIYANELYMRPCFASALGQAYHNVLASTPVDAYRDAGELHFASSSSVRSEFSVGYRARPTYCVAPIMDDGGAGGVAGGGGRQPQGRATTFWAIGIDCCGPRGQFNCGSTSSRAALRAAPDGLIEHRTAEFLNAIKQACAVYDLTTTDDMPILVHLSENPTATRNTQFLKGLGVLFAGAGVFVAMALIAYTVDQQRGSSDSL